MNDDAFRKANSFISYSVFLEHISSRVSVYFYSKHDPYINRDQIKENIGSVLAFFTGFSQEVHMQYVRITIQNLFGFMTKHEE